LVKGNHTEDQIIKSIIKSNKNGKVLQTKRKRPENDYISKKNKKKKSEDNDFDYKNNSFKEITNYSEKEIISNLNKDKDIKENYNDDNYSLNKSADSNRILSISVIHNFNDETFENIIKEFLKINDFPKESKEKINLLKKFISIYKKIKDDNSKLHNFLIKISEKLTEPYNDIKVKNIV